MKNPSLLVDAIVTKLRDIPDLVAALGGDATNIHAYHDLAPLENNLGRAVFEMKAPGILVVWNKTRQGSQRKYVHDFVLYARPGSLMDGDSLFSEVVNGVPVHGDGLKFEQTPIDPSCGAVKDLPGADRQTDDQGRDYFPIRISLEEEGPN